MAGLLTIAKTVGIILCALFVLFCLLGMLTKMNSTYENDYGQKNPMEGKKVIFIESKKDKENSDGVCGHFESVGEENYRPGFYEKYIKRCLDILLSFIGLVVLSPILLLISIPISIDDPGPILFTQKRMGRNKRYFKLHKFRFMKMCTPHDVPTHMLENPEQYITTIGRFMRSHIIDELPQIWDIFIGNMFVIGPRPGLWNQDLLTKERDRYYAKSVKPGLTGWAQINGRDELGIYEKAKIDGDYVKKLGFLMDFRCFMGSLWVFVYDDSLVKGGEVN